MSLPDHNTPHDSAFKQVFSRPENALALLRAKLPAAVVDAIVPDSLEHEPSPAPDDELRERFTDVLMRGRLRDGREVKVYFLLEHQHQQDRWMTVRVLGYLVRIWEDWRRENTQAERLPLVIPLVLHQGPGPWSVARSMDELYDATPALLAALGPIVPRLELPFLDLGGRPPSLAAEIPGPPLARLTLVLLRGMADPERDLGDLLEEHASLVVPLVEQPGGKGDLRLLILYGVYQRTGASSASVAGSAGRTGLPSSAPRPWPTLASPRSRPSSGWRRQKRPGAGSTWGSGTSERAGSRLSVRRGPLGRAVCGS